MPKPLIFNSTPLIYLTRSSLTEFLKEIPLPKFTATSVFKEVINEGKKKGVPEASFLETLLIKKQLKFSPRKN